MARDGFVATAGGRLMRGDRGPPRPLEAKCPTVGSVMSSPHWAISTCGVNLDGREWCTTAQTTCWCGMRTEDRFADVLDRGVERVAVRQQLGDDDAVSSI